METAFKEKEFTKKGALWPFVKRMFIHGFQYKKIGYALVGSAALVAIIDGLLPLIWYKFIDDFITPTVLMMKERGTDSLPHAAFTTLYWFAGTYLAVILIQVAGATMFTYCAGRIKEFVIYDLRRDMFKKLQELPYAFFDNSSMGWLTIRLTADVDKVSEIISFGFVSLITGFMMIIVSLLAMFIYNWQLASIVLLAIPLMVVLSIRIRMLILKYSRQARRIYSQMAAFLTENINGIEVNKATVHEERASLDFMDVSETLRGASFKAAYYTAMYNPVIVLMGSIVAAAVIYFGGMQVLAPASGFTIGLLAAFFGYARMIFEPIMEITRFYAAAQDSLSAGERIFSLIDEPVSIFDAEDARPSYTLSGRVTFENVSFHYVADKPVIPNFNLSIKSGESLAIVGPTGEGKSTIINLLCRFYEPTGGRILIDEKDYKTITLNSYRSRLGVILQTAYLFSGTVRENIRYGKLSATEEEIVEALNIIGAGTFLERLDEEVGEEGNKLSAGEKQLIAFARVILKDPDILIMDEATSSMDIITEQKIQHGINQILKKRTAVIIAHRLSTIRNCDRIIVIKKGGIIEMGNHRELMSSKGFYHHLYTRQMRDIPA